MQIQQIYEKLLEAYGQQGWWPLVSHKGGNPTKTGSLRGYHPGEYSFPKNTQQRFEICVGAILTQNTSWTNVEKAVLALDALNALDAKSLLALDEEALKDAIRPAGYFNQKAKKLKLFAHFFIELKGRVPSREELLDLWGIGPETADSILLYAYAQAHCVVDAYTKRIFVNLGIIPLDAAYDEVKKMMHEDLPNDITVYQEMHALLVEHAKRCYQKRPFDDVLLIQEQ